ncbi:tetratricopeptide repeat protein [Croceicoccus bisphenolivorans]|uniref:tetratricopeptide repeat protein n=1 Tax=Croceicoccus bisphenolivorans TaxID=1783232 RepID=UPI00082DE0C2|nr:tetratricopeptide repeat protein [Croceicoccus bisphenolivorans]
MKRSFSRTAMAVALSLGTVGVMGMAASPALAAKKKSGGGEYSKEFIAVYQPLSEKAEADPATAAAEIGTLSATIASADEKLAGGQLIYNLGAKTSNTALQYQGIKLMADSGKIAPEQAGKVFLAAGQLGYNAQDYAAARGYLEQAATLMPADPAVPATLAEVYVQQKDYPQALATIEKAIALRKAAGEAPADTDAFRGLAIAANNGLNDQAALWAVRVIESNPRDEYRTEAYKVLSALSRYTKEEELDLLRLMYRADALSDRRQYMAYLAAADARRRPAEVKTLVEAGIAAGLLTSTDSLAGDELKLASGRYDSVLRELNADAKGSLDGAAALAVGDTYLGYGKGADAEAMYRKAIAAGVADKDRALTGLGIALADQGKFDEAKTTFGQVSGASRSQLARLWIAYVNDKAG